LKTVYLRGYVFSGKGEGAGFMQLPWVKKQIQDKFGFTPYPGTLDIKLTEESVRSRKSMTEGGVVILPAKGFYKVRCFRATLNGKMPCVVTIPEVPDYPENVLEIIGEQNLREKLHLSDGDLVEVTVTV
jgi:CTP-dependent riboflavin kinase